MTKSNFVLLFFGILQTTIFNSWASAAAPAAKSLILCDDYKTQIHFFVQDSSLKMEIDLRDGHGISTYGISPGDTDIVAFFRQRSTNVLNAVGPAEGEGLPASRLTITHVDGRSQFMWASGNSFTKDCTLPDGSPAAPPLPRDSGPPVQYPVCQRSAAIRNFLEEKLHKDCGSITPEDLRRVDEIDLANQNISEMKNGDLEAIGPWMYPNLWVEMSAYEKGMCNSLRTVSLSHNQLTDLPDDLFGLENIPGSPFKGDRCMQMWRFNASQNSLKRVPRFFPRKFDSKEEGKKSDAAKASAIIFSYLEDPDQEATKGTPRPRIDLSHNNIEEYENFYFRTTRTNFIEVDLSHNKISILPNRLTLHSAFTCRHEPLIDLSLSNNLITNESLRAVESICLGDQGFGVGGSLSIENNPLTSFDLTVFQPRIRSLKIGGTDQIKFDISGLLGPEAPRYSSPDPLHAGIDPDIGSLRISNCVGTPVINDQRENLTPNQPPPVFPVTEMLQFNDCNISIPNGFGKNSRFAQISFADVALRRILPKVINDIFYDGYFSSYSNEIYRLGRIVISGQSKINSSDLAQLNSEVLKVRSQLKLLPWDHVQQWDCKRPNDWDWYFDKNLCENTLEISPEVQVLKN